MPSSFSEYFTENSAIQDALDVSDAYSQQDFVQTLQNNGWQTQDTENGTTLLTSPDDQWAVKFFHPRKNAAEAEFARFAMENPSAAENPHIVRTEHIGRLKDSYFVVMENLKPLDLTTRANHEAHSSFKSLTEPMHMNRERKEAAAEYLRENNPELLEAVTKSMQHAIWLSQGAPIMQGIKPTGISTGIDAHYGNIMMRRNDDGSETIVLIDQFQMRPWPQNKSLTDGQKETLDVLGINPRETKRSYEPFREDYIQEKFEL